MIKNYFFFFLLFIFKVLKKINLESNNSGKALSVFSCFMKGTAIVTADKAALWTDGRYFLQAQLEMDSNWILMKDGML